MQSAVVMVENYKDVRLLTKREMQCRGKDAGMGYERKYLKGEPRDCGNELNKSSLT